MCKNICIAIRGQLSIVDTLQLLWFQGIILKNFTLYVKHYYLLNCLADPFYLIFQY